jgi:RNA polymerase sigma factor (sigma-70 family)
VTRPSAEQAEPAGDTANLVAQARAGDHVAFDRLHALYERAIVGFVRVRVANDEDAYDVVQDTWLQVWQKLSTYDPARASFVTFVKYWAGVLLLRAYERRDRRRGVEVLAQDLVKRFPELADTDGVSDILDRLATTADQQSEPPPPTDAYDELLRATFASPSPPHQLVAFGLIKCLGWTPRRVASEVADVALDACTQRLERGYLDISQLPDQQVRPAFDVLRERLKLRFGEAVGDAKTQSTYTRLKDRVVGETCLRDYFTGDDPAADLTQWWYAVYRRVRGEVQRRSEGPLYRLAAQRAARKADKRGM